MAENFLYTIFDISKALRISDKSIRRYIKDGELNTTKKDPPHGKGGVQRVYISAESLIRLARIKDIRIDIDSLRPITSDQILFQQLFEVPEPQQTSNIPTSSTENLEEATTNNKPASDSAVVEILKEQLEKAEAQIVKLEGERDSFREEAKEHAGRSDERAFQIGTARTQVGELLEYAKAMITVTNRNIELVKKKKLDADALNLLPMPRMNGERIDWVEDENAESVKQQILTPVVPQEGEETKVTVEEKTKPVDISEAEVIIPEESKARTPKKKTTTKKKKRTKTKKKKSSPATSKIKKTQKSKEEPKNGKKGFWKRINPFN